MAKQLLLLAAEDATAESLYALGLFLEPLPTILAQLPAPLIVLFFSKLSPWSILVPVFLAGGLLSIPVTKLLTNLERLSPLPQ